MALMNFKSLFLSAIVLGGGAMLASELEITLPNQLRVHQEPRNMGGLLRLELRVVWASQSLEGETWLAEELAKALKGGAAGRSRQEMEGHLIDAGIRVKLEAGERFLSWSMLMDNQVQEQGFAALADRVFRSALDGEGCALDWQTRQMLFKRLINPHRAVLWVQGNVDRATLHRLALQNFGTWRIQDGEGVLPKRPRTGFFELPMPDQGPREGAVNVLLAEMLQQRVETLDSSVSLGGHRDGQPTPIRVPEGVKSWMEGLVSKGFLTGDLQKARTKLLAERASLGLHSAKTAAHHAHALLMGDPGEHFNEVSLAEVNEALKMRWKAALAIHHQEKQ